MTIKMEKSDDINKELSKILSLANEIDASNRELTHDEQKLLSSFIDRGIQHLNELSEIEAHYENIEKKSLSSEENFSDGLKQKFYLSFCEPLLILSKERQLLLDQLFDIRTGLVFSYIILKDLPAAKDQIAAIHKDIIELKKQDDDSLKQSHLLECEFKYKPGIVESILFESYFVEEDKPRVERYKRDAEYNAYKEAILAGKYQSLAESAYFKATGEKEKSFWAYNKAFHYCQYNYKKSPEDWYKRCDPFEKYLIEGWDKRCKAFVKYLIDEEQYVKRRLICTLNDIPPIDESNTIIPVSIKNIGDLKFPFSHPVLNGIYVGHPLIPNRYYPVDAYKEALFQSKVMELNTILQALGATKIRIERIEGESSSDFKSGHVESHAKDKNEREASGSYLGASGSVKGGSESGSDVSKKESFHEQISKIDEMKTGQRLAPKIRPHIPEGLIWFEHEETWMQLAKQRMSGEILDYQITISTESLQLVNNTDVKNISDDFKMFAEASFKHSIIKAEARSNKEKQTSSMSDFASNDMKQQKKVWNIYVDFAPKSELLEDPPPAAKAIFDISENEKEYLEMLNDAYEDGVVSEDERRMLNKRKQKLGISDQRAREIEDKTILKQRKTGFLSRFFISIWEWVKKTMAPIKS